MERLSKWNGTKYVLPQGRWRDICDRLGAYEETGFEQKTGAQSPSSTK